MKTFLQWRYVGEFFWEWEMFQIKAVEKTKTHILRSITFFSRKSCRLWDNFKTYGGAKEATDDNIIGRKRFACWVSKATSAHASAQKYVILIDFSRQQSFLESALVLCFTYIATLVTWNSPKHESFKRRFMAHVSLSLRQPGFMPGPFCVVSVVDKRNKNTGFSPFSIISPVLFLHLHL
jgi:hypothetical protein